MKKFWRTIASPKLLFAILIILEIFLIVGGYIFLDSYLAVVLESEVENAKNLADFIKILVVLIFRVALSIVALLVFFKIINREENPEYKIPWITFLFLFPAITLTFYFVFVRVKMRRKDRKFLFLQICLTKRTSTVSTARTSVTKRRKRSAAATEEVRRNETLSYIIYIMYRDALPYPPYGMSGQPLLRALSRHA